MSSPEDQNDGPNKPALPPRSSGGRRRGRRGGRGRDPRPLVKPAPTEENILPPPATTVAETAAAEITAPAETPRPRTPAPVFKRADVSAISRASDEVRQIVESLEQTLEQMEEVLRLVESAENQKSADERELESLRRLLRKVQPPRARPEREERPPQSD